MEEKKKPTVVDHATEILLLKDKIDKLTNAMLVSKGCTSSYAKINISANGSTDWVYLDTLKALNVNDIANISELIRAYLVEKLIPLEEELNSYVISKKL